MKKTILAAMIGALFGKRDNRPRTPRGRMRFRDNNQTSIPFRMNAGIAGDPSRFHPLNVEANLIDAVSPPLFYGQPVLQGAANVGVRPYGVADQSDVTASDPWGFTVRPFPAQQNAGGMTSNFGSGTPPVAGVIDVLRMGYIMAVLPAGDAAPAKGDPVFVWCAATAGAHVQGQITSAASAGNTTKLGPRYQFGGPPDAAGNVEICVNV
jgi:hypothetical protein